MQKLLEAKNIKKSFNGVPALIDGNLTCKSGKILGLLGANGSGKSTINKCIVGVYKKNSGEILLEGKAVNFNNPMEAKKAGIAMAFQNLSLLPDLTVWQNIVIGFEKKKGIFLDDRDAQEIAKKLLSRFFEDFDIDRLVSELNPSEKQIVEIVKAVSVNPKVLILDEPTAALEQSQVKILFKMMREFVSKGNAIIFTSHRMWEVMEICDEVVIFKNGINTGYVDFDVDGKNETYIIEKISGKTGIEDVPDRAEHRIYKKFDGEDRLLEVKHLSYKNVVNDVSLEIHKGEIVGIGGLSGQGQEELLLSIAGNYKDIEGEVWLKSKKQKFILPADAIEQGVVLVPGDRQTQGLMMDKSIYENSILPRVSLRKEPFIIPNKIYRQDCIDNQTTLSTKYENIEECVSNLSGGNAQKVVLGKWLSLDLSILILSDPAKGVDVGAKEDMYSFINKVAAEKELGVLLYATDNEELINNCNRVYVMHEGKIVGELRGEEITDANIIKLSMLGRKAGVN